MAESVILAGGTNHGRTINLLHPVNELSVPRRRDASEAFADQGEPRYVDDTERYRRITLDVNGAITRQCFLLVGADAETEVMRLAREI
jgi:chloramphenicol 3-O-phosphotransferase